MSSQSENAQIRRPVAEPVLKWAGGKRRLLEQYTRHFKKPFTNYHEPFFGGGAVYFWLRAQGKLEDRACYLTDINPELINFYQVLKGHPEALFGFMLDHQEKHSEEHYYLTRGLDLSKMSDVERAARLLYLNRTCFNGLYRENSQGKFNVPMGRYKSPRIYHPEGLTAASAALQPAILECRAYSDVEERALPGDLVYLDPPYHPLTSTANFTSYTQRSFTEQDQEALALLYTRLTERGVRVLLSNSDTPLIRKLYKKFRKFKIQAARAINSRADRRAKITELLIVP